jgi:hypothetical protein
MFWALPYDLNLHFCLRKCPLALEIKKYGRSGWYYILSLAMKDISLLRGNAEFFRGLLKRGETRYKN